MRVIERMAAEIAVQAQAHRRIDRRAESDVS